MGSVVAPIEVRYRSVGVDAVRNGMKLVAKDAQDGMRAVQSGSSHAAAGFLGMSHSMMIGVGELSRGIGKVAEAGEVGAFAMREFTDAAFRLGEAIGPAGGLIAIFMLLGHAVYEVMTKTRREMEETRKKFEDEIGKMANAGQSVDLQKQLRDLEFGTPYMKGKDGTLELHKLSAFSSGAFEGSLKDLQGKREHVALEMWTALHAGNVTAGNAFRRQVEELDKELKPLVEQRDKLIAAAMNVANQPATMTGMMPFKVTSKTNEAIAKSQETADDAAKTAMDHLMEGIARQMPRFHEGMTSATLEAMDAANRAIDLNKLLVKYAPNVDHSKSRDQADEMMYGLKPKVGVIKQTETQRIIEEFNDKVQQPLGRAIREGMAHTLGSAIADGVTAGFESHSIGGAFKAAGKAILAGIGSILQQMGEIWISYGVAMTSLGQALWNPFTSGPAAIAIGAMLIALGAAAGAAAHGGRGAGASGAGSGSLPAIVNTAFVDPTNGAAARGTSIAPRKDGDTYYVIGEDPKAWRQVQERLDRNGKR